MRYKVFDPESKVIGQSMLGFKAAANFEMIEPLLEKYDLTNIQADQWYPLQQWLNVLSDISEQTSDYDSMLTFVNIGQKVAASIYIPDDVQSYIRRGGFVDFLVQSGNATYYRDHQGNVGKNTIRKVSDNHLLFELNTPYPPDFWYGMSYGIAKRYCSSFIVHYEDLAMRTYGTSETIIIHVVVEEV